MFCAAILNSQPMGFYQPAQLVRDARQHGVEVRAADVNFSDWDCTLEPALEPARHRFAVRLGFRQILGLRKEEIKDLVAARGNGYASIERLGAIGGVSRFTIERLAEADAFRSLGLDRRAALWAARRLDTIGIQKAESAKETAEAEIRSLSHVGGKLFDSADRFLCLPHISTTSCFRNRGSRCLPCRSTSMSWKTIWRPACR